MIGEGGLPFWLGGIGLAAVAVLHLYFSQRDLSVSGVLARVLRWSADEQERLAEERLAAGALDAALLAATRARFGGDRTSQAAQAVPDAVTACGSSSSVRLPVAAGAVFLVAIAVGGALGAVADGAGAHTAQGLGLGEEFARLFGTDAVGIGVLALGGFLVGFGARLAGGCTSRHGLCGSARLAPSSLLATAAFFAGGVAVSCLLEALR